MNKYKAFTLSLISVVMFFSTQPAMASPIKWKNLTSIQKDVLKPHALKWNTYRETKQKRLLKQSSKEVSRKNAWRNWYNGKLTQEERKTFVKNKSKLSETQFKRYVATLFKKYGKPGH